MGKTILITGGTDGIGLEAAALLRPAGHDLLLHGRDPQKLAAKVEQIAAVSGSGRVAAYQADLSDLAQVYRLAEQIAASEPRIDTLINNAGVFGIAEPRTIDGLDARFAVNTIAPYILARALAGSLGAGGRIVNLSSAAQSPVDLAALVGPPVLSDNAAYAQSKLALTMWTRHLADAFGASDPSIFSVNPGSFLATKMVKEAYGMQGNDTAIGAEILARAAVDDGFGPEVSGRYFDNDRGNWGDPHPDAADPRKIAALVDQIEAFLSSRG